MQITKPYSTNNLYGDSHEDLIATVEYLQENTNQTDKVIAFDHVGYYFGNEKAKYFGLGKIKEDQLKDFAKRKSMDLETAKKWLNPNLAE